MNTNQQQELRTTLQISAELLFVNGVKEIRIGNIIPLQDGKKIKNYTILSIESLHFEADMLVEVEVMLLENESSTHSLHAKSTEKIIAFPAGH